MTYARLMKLDRLMLVERLCRRALKRLRWLAHWRCVEPVVVFESDDWGLERRPCSELLRAYGEPGEWAEESEETDEDMERLFQVLERHRDPLGCSARFTANVVVTNPDFDAIIATGCTRYTYRRLCDRVIWKLCERMDRRVLLPQYHGLYHFRPDAWLRDLQADTPGARELMIHRCHGGLSLLRGQGWRYHSEYVDWWQPVDPPHSAVSSSEISEGLNLFESVFRVQSSSTIAPHYILPLRAEAKLARAGIKYLQGAGYRILRAQTGMHIISHALGETAPSGLLCLTRTVKFDPRPQRPGNGVKQAVDTILRYFHSGIPAVVDTHRINYTGRWGPDGARALEELLSALSPHRPRFLTSIELAEAIESDGVYRDIWTGQYNKLTPIDPDWRQELRTLLARINNWCAKAVEQHCTRRSTRALPTETHSARGMPHGL